MEPMELAADVYRAKMAYMSPSALRKLFADPPPDEVAQLVLAQAYDLEVHEADEAFACSWFVGSLLVIAIRGTVVKYWRNVADDFDVASVTPSWLPEGVQVHGGFLRHFEHLQPLLQARLASTSNVHFVGHSLGGAAASLACWHALATLPCIFASLTTVGAPRVGNAAYATWCAGHAGPTTVIIIESVRDPIPRLPGWLVEPWCTELQRFQVRGGLLPDVLAHDLDIYFLLCEGKQPGALDYLRVLWRRL